MIARPPLAVPLLALAAFLTLLVPVTTGWTPLDRLDTAVSEAFRAYGVARPGLVSVLRVATDVAATVPFLVAGLAVSTLFAARRDRRHAAFCALVTVAVPVLWTLMHLLIYSPRPRNGFVVATSNSFPSGHTSNAAAAALAAVLLLWPRGTRARRGSAVLLAAAFAIFIGITRVALLAHWPADVIGGWLLALVVVPIAALLADRIPARPAKP
jgi:undecaprenyl-diphosphatase